MFAAFLRIETKDVKDTYGDKSKKVAVVPLGAINDSGLAKTVIDQSVGTAVLLLADSEVILTSASFVVDDKIAVTVNVITPGKDH